MSKVDLSPEWKTIANEILQSGCSTESFLDLSIFKDKNSPLFISKNEIKNKNKFKLFCSYKKYFILSICFIILSYYMGRGYSYIKEGLEPDEICLIELPGAVTAAFRPLSNCNLCADITKVDRVSKINSVIFEEKYAYSQQPVIITDAAVNWTASTVFNFEYFKKLFFNDTTYNTKSANCQFFPYKTNFKTLEEALNMTDDFRRDMKWYIGWSNCNPNLIAELRQHYKRPYFLPETSHSLKTDWIFMGSPGYGANMHVDSVGEKSWQAQIKGRKTWTLEPPPECYYVCKNRLVVTVNPNEIIVLDTNFWYHSTLIIGDETSITIGAEYD